MPIDNKPKGEPIGSPWPALIAADEKGAISPPNRRKSSHLDSEGTAV
jgi:hypothetical protein